MRPTSLFAAAIAPVLIACGSSQTTPSADVAASPNVSGPAWAATITASPGISTQITGRATLLEGVYATPEDLDTPHHK